MKSWIAGLFLLCVLTVSLDVTAQEVEYTPYQQALKDFFEASGTLDSMEPTIDHMLQVVAEVHPAFTEEVVEIYKKEIKVEFVNNYIFMMADVYRKWLTEEDLNEMVTFFRSPVGHKWAVAIPAMRMDAIYIPYQQALKDFFEASGTLESMEPSIQHILQVVAEVHPAFTAEVVKAYKEEIKVEFVDNYILMMEDVYKKWLTEEDLNEMVDFFQSPVGLKWAVAVPAMRMDAMTIGQELGVKIAQRLTEKLTGEELMEW